MIWCFFFLFFLVRSCVCVCVPNLLDEDNLHSFSFHCSQLFFLAVIHSIYTIVVVVVVVAIYLHLVYWKWKIPGFVLFFVSHFFILISANETPPTTTTTTTKTWRKNPKVWFDLWYYKSSLFFTTRDSLFVFHLPFFIFFFYLVD